jgi:hypothetical protein
MLLHVGALQKEKKCEEVRSKCGTHKSRVILPSFLVCVVFFFGEALFQSQQEAFIPRVINLAVLWAIESPEAVPQMVPDPQDRQKFLKLLQSPPPSLPFSKSFCCKLTKF